MNRFRTVKFLGFILLMITTAGWGDRAAGSRFPGPAVSGIRTPFGRVLTTPPPRLPVPLPDQAAGGDYGTADAVEVTYLVSHFVQGDTPAYTTDTYGYLSRTGGTNEFYYAGVELPEGARVDSVRFYYYDSNATADLSFWWCEMWTEDGTGANPGADCPIFGTSSGTPGYAAADLVVNQTIDTSRDVTGDAVDDEVQYALSVGLPVTDTTLRFKGAKITYHLQVSPAPATATFTDVPPTHPFFQYVEALVASGITSGCAPGKYCPDAPLTRGQMAVFLSRALGLHWSAQYP